LAAEAEKVLLEEWKQTREVLKAFDDRIHDLRKYGFSFVTGLITLQGFLLPWVPPSESTEAAGIPDEAKFGVLVATILLIIVLRWIDGNYRGLQYGAATRSKVIERLLNLELTNEMSLRYELDRLWVAIIILYLGFEGAVIGFALALLGEHYVWIIYLTSGVVAEGYFYYRYGSPDKLRGTYRGADWALDRLECAKGDSIRIIMTNLLPVKRKLIWDKKEKAFTTKITRMNPIIWRIGAEPWKITDKHGKDVLGGSEPVVNQIVVQSGSSHVWSWKADVPPGIYRVQVLRKSAATGDQISYHELARKIHVIESKPDKKQDQRKEKLTPA
jgi:hypothetical protein